MYRIYEIIHDEDVRLRSLKYFDHPHNTPLYRIKISENETSWRISYLTITSAPIAKNLSQQLSSQPLQSHLPLNETPPSRYISRFPIIVEIPSAQRESKIARVLVARDPIRAWSRFPFDYRLAFRSVRVACRRHRCPTPDG